MKTKLIITNEANYHAKPKKGVLRFSNKQWSVNSARLEGYQFGDVIVNCALDDGLREWLHMHLGIRVERIIYT